jgi:hypothetical protein
MAMHSEIRSQIPGRTPGSPFAPHDLLDTVVTPAGAVAAMARSENIKVQMSGRNAAYQLGLVDERPKECVYLTTGPSKCISIGNQIVELRHDTSSAMLGAGTRAGMVISALKYLGDGGVTGKMLVKIHRQLSPGTAQQLRRFRAYVPLWMRECIDALTATIR